MVVGLRAGAQNLSTRWGEPLPRTRGSAPLPRTRGEADPLACWSQGQSGAQSATPLGLLLARAARVGGVTTAGAASAGRSSRACLGNEGGGCGGGSSVRLLNLFHEEHAPCAEEGRHRVGHGDDGGTRGEPRGEPTQVLMTRVRAVT
jgi:hypothetical protein